MFAIRPNARAALVALASAIGLTLLCGLVLLGPNFEEARLFMPGAEVRVGNARVVARFSRDWRDGRSRVAYYLRYALVAPGRRGDTHDTIEREVTERRWEDAREGDVVKLRYPPGNPDAAYPDDDDPLATARLLLPAVAVATFVVVWGLLVLGL